MKSAYLSHLVSGSHDEEPDVFNTGDVICINPYHYIITAEAEAR